MAVDLDGAFKKAVASFYEKEDYFKNTEKLTGKKVKYNKDFFTTQEKHIRKSNKKAMSKAEQEKGENAKSPIPSDDEGDQ